MHDGDVHNSSIDPFWNKDSEDVPGSYQIQEVRELKDLYTNFHQSLVEDYWVGEMRLIPRHCSPDERKP